MNMLASLCSEEKCRNFTSQVSTVSFLYVYKIDSFEIQINFNIQLVPIIR